MEDIEDLIMREWDKLSDDEQFDIANQICMDIDGRYSITWNVCGLNHSVDGLQLYIGEAADSISIYDRCIIDDDLKYYLVAYLDIDDGEAVTATL